MSRIVFLLEERSMQVLLDGLLPRLFPDLPFLCVPHEGKRDLELSIPRKLRAWREPGVRFAVIRDNDGGNCVQLKAALRKLCKAARRGNRTLDSRVSESVGRTAHGAAFDPRGKSLQQFSCAHGGYRGDDGGYQWNRQIDRPEAVPASRETIRDCSVKSRSASAPPSMRRSRRSIRNWSGCTGISAG